MNWKAIAITVAAVDVLLCFSRRRTDDIASSVLDGAVILILVGLFAVLCSEGLGKVQGYVQSGCYIMQPTPPGMFVFFGLLLLGIPFAFGLYGLLAKPATDAGRSSLEPLRGSSVVAAAGHFAAGGEDRVFRTVRDAELETVRRYPDIGVAGTKLNADFVQRYRLYREMQPGYFGDNGWPLRLAGEVVMTSRR